MFAATADYTHLAAALGYAFFATALAVRSARSGLARLLTVAALGTVLWASISVLAGLLDLPAWSVSLTEPIRDACWFTVLLVMLRPLSEDRKVWLGLVLLTCIDLILDGLFQAGVVPNFLVLGFAVNAVSLRIFTSVLGLVLVENLVRNLPVERLWAIKSLAIGLFFLLISELLVRIPQFLTGNLDEDFLAFRPLVFLLVLPLFIVSAIRSPAFQLQIHSSRRIVLHFTTLVCVGVVLQGTALAALYVRRYGGNNGTILALIMAFAGLIALAIGIASASVRSRLRIFINENFFSYRYDYRLEWDRFIRAMSSWEDEGLPVKVLRILTDLMDSQGGALWLARDQRRIFVSAARRQCQGEFSTIPRGHPALEPFEADDCTYLDLSVTKDGAAAIWHEAYPTGWLVVPLRDRATLIGLILLQKSRAPRKLDWEDQNLISIVALQLGSYLAQAETARALADGQQLDQFNKRFAFILHDVKNTIGQLSLLVRNVEQFGHEEEFRKDMVLTVRDSVTRLQELLAKLKAVSSGETEKHRVETVDIGDMLADYASGKQRIGLNVTLEPHPAETTTQLADRQEFLNVLDHIVGNALDVTAHGNVVILRVTNTGPMIEVTVEDSGPGMTAEFIAEDLFRPLRSTKGTGFGIGAFQARELMRQLGGDIEVQSQLGLGTRFKLLLPRVAALKEVVQT